MSFLFGGKKVRPPAEVVKATKDAILALNNQKANDKAVEEVARGITSMKLILYGEEGQEPSPDAIVLLSNEIYSNDLLPLLVKHIAKYDFETKKDIGTVFSNLLRRQIGSRYPTVEYICRNAGIMETLVRGFDNPDVVLTCGAMLREAVKHEALCKLVLYSPNFWEFFKFVEEANFDVAADAFTTFKDLLTKHKTLAAEFLEKNYDEFFEKYTELLYSNNYVTKRQSLKLLGELLLDRANFNIMTRYISSSTNLKLMMNLLRDKSRSIQFEAFHVFKVFVANPNKTKTINEILVHNKDKLIGFLNSFHNDKEEDQFNDEKAFLLKQIAALSLD